MKEQLTQSHGKHSYNRGSNSLLCKILSQCLKSARLVGVSGGEAGLLKTLLGFGGGKNNHCGPVKQSTQIIRSHWNMVNSKDLCPPH